jgi:hypothetical protein
MAAGAKISHRTMPTPLAAMEPTRRERIQDMPTRRKARGRKMTAMPRVCSSRSERYEPTRPVQL